MDNSAQFILAIDRKNMFTDYEHFVVPVKSIKQKKSSFFDHNKVILEFNKGSYIEVITGKRFIKVDENIYYNEDTGLYFTLPECPPYISFHLALAYLCDSNFVYRKDINKFFKYYETINKKDSELRAKGIQLTKSL